jgi:hypothetical protein
MFPISMIIRPAVPNCLTKLGYIEEPNKLGWRQLKSLCLTADANCNAKSRRQRKLHSVLN